jgi:ATP-dependent DNA helicase DinG
MPDALARIFSEDGPFAALLPRWQPREGQIRMARAVAGCLADGGASLVEAGTGTGKTLAYLVPAVLSGLRVIVSTGTHTLQEQLLRKDIPLVREALGAPFEAALLKGRANYLCLRRFALAGEVRYRRAEDARHHDAIRGWAVRTRTGDRAEIPGLPDDFPGWRLLSATSEQCLGQACADYEPCFVFRARRAAMAAGSSSNPLFFADLRSGPRPVRSSPADAVISTRRTQIEQVAPPLPRRSVSSGRLQDLCRRAARGARALRRKGPPESLEAAPGRGEGEGRRVLRALPAGGGPGAIRPGTIPAGSLEPGTRPSCGSRRPSRPGRSSIRTTRSGPARSARGTSRAISSR